MENHFDSSDEFDESRGLNLAVAVFNPLNPSFLQPLDHSYGRIRIRKFGWEFNELGNMMQY